MRNYFFAEMNSTRQWWRVVDAATGTVVIDFIKMRGMADRLAFRRTLECSKP